MNSITQLHNTTPSELTDKIFEGIHQRLVQLKKDFQPRIPEEYLTRKETSNLLKIALPTLHDWCNKGILKPYKIGNRTYFMRSEIEFTLRKSNS